MFYEDDNRRTFTLHLNFVGERAAFELNQDSFIDYMEETFHESVNRAMSKTREELKKLRSAGQKSML